MRLSIVVAVLLSASAAGAVWYTFPQIHQPAEEAAIPVGDASAALSLRGPGGQLAIPNSWHLVVVSPGDATNTSNLWFQDADGSVFLLRGFTSNGMLYVHEGIRKIPVR